MVASGIPCPLVSLVGYRFWQHDRYANCKVAFTFERVRSIFSPLFSCPSFEREKKKIRQGDTVQQKQSRINIRLYIKRDVLRFRIDVSH